MEPVTVLFIQRFQPEILVQNRSSASDLGPGSVHTAYSTALHPARQLVHLGSNLSPAIDASIWMFCGLEACNCFRMLLYEFDRIRRGKIRQLRYTTSRRSLVDDHVRDAFEKSEFKHNQWRGRKVKVTVEGATALDLLLKLGTFPCLVRQYDRQKVTRLRLAST